ncbi:MAG: hypothetical protein ACK53K_00155 [Burkholderiales bacterium]
MSAKLLEHFDLLATAPDGVARLRELILTLAVQGKLVLQDPNDEPASVLLQRIRGEKDRLIAEGKIKRDKPLLPITDEEKPFALPKEWAWVRLGDVTNYGSPSKAQELKPETWVLDMEDIEKSSGRLLQRLRFAQRPALSEKNSFSAGDVLYGKLRPYLNKVLVADEDGVCTTEIIPFRCYGGYVPQYFRLVLGSPFFLEYVNARSYGMKMPRLGTEDARKSVIPLPALSEQSRIVSSVEELMRLCDALEAKRQLDSTQHAQLLHTLLGTLTDSATPEELSANWQRVATHFDLLLDRPEAVDALEQTILQLAVRGLLVPQDPNDEPASVLLQRVAESAAAHSKKGLKANTDSYEATPPYELPAGWDWCQLGNIVENMGSGWSPACDEGERSDPTKWAVLRTTAVQVNEYRAREHKILPSKLSPRPEIEVKDGDILITRAGPMNRVGISCWVNSTPPRLMLSDKIVRFHSVGDEMLPAFIVLTLNAGWTKSQIEAAKTGMAASQVNISQTDLRGLWLPVCSKAEQSRIVARVEELRQLCTDLRQRLTASRTTQGHLAEALVECV